MLDKALVNSLATSIAMTTASDDETLFIARQRYKQINSRAKIYAIHDQSYPGHLFMFTSF
jgi:hypothetical protein